MKIVCIDINGTSVHHESGEPIPLMPELVRAFQSDGWRTIFLTCWQIPEAMSLLIPFFSTCRDRMNRVEIVASADKAKVLSSLLKEYRLERLVFFDDKPQNFLAAAEVRSDALQVIAFLGSGKYAPTSKFEAKRKAISFAHSPIDLAVYSGEAGIARKLELADSGMR
jgi:hypothetical protein